AQALGMPASCLARGIRTRAESHLGAGPYAHGASGRRIDERRRDLADVEQAQRAVPQRAAADDAESVDETTVDLGQDQGALVGLWKRNVQAASGEQRDANSQNLPRADHAMEPRERVEVGRDEAFGELRLRDERHIPPR